MSTETPTPCPPREDSPKLSALDLRHAARMFRKLPMDSRDARGKQLKRDAIAELLRLAERRSARSE
jgi:hypothetical protein